MATFETPGGDSLETFHDDSIYAIRLISPEPDQKDWRSELVLDIDHILDWIRHDNGQISFRLVQANLCFANVSNLKVTFGYPDTSISPLPIDRIACSDKAAVTRGDYQEFDWEIALNDQLSGALTFRSAGHRLEKTGRPIECEQQQIPQHLRINWVGK